MDVGMKTNIGTRKTNQDFYYRSSLHPFYIIADGMGGHNAGEVASRLSAELIADHLELKLGRDLKDDEIKETIEEAIKKANKIVYEKSLEKDEFKGMGTTISLAYIRDKNLFIGHVGDSSIFIVSDEGIIKLTRDHSLVEELLKKGSITKEEARNHPQRNVITRAVGTARDIEVDILSENIGEGDVLVLCTDGLTNMVEREEIQDKILELESLEDACEDLVEKAKNRGGHDNISIMAIRI